MIEIAVFDLDGVLADSQERIRRALRPDGSVDPALIDQGILELDVPVKRNIEWINALSTEYYTHPQIWTARPESTRQATMQWLDKVGIHCHCVRMANEFTGLEGAVALKRSWVRLVGPKNIKFAVDDREEIIEMYRSEGVQARHFTL